jgi:hypothetical protein
MSLGATGFERKTKRTRKREFLDEMIRVEEKMEKMGPAQTRYSACQLSTCN